MKLLMTWALMLLLGVTAFAQQTAVGQQPSAPQKPKHLIGNSQVFGPVKTIRDEQTTFENRDGKLVEGTRVLFVLLTVSEDELNQDRIVYRPDGQIGNHVISIYNPDGSLQETKSLNPKGEFMIRSVFSYVDRRLSEIVTYNNNGVLMSRTVYRRDGKQVQSETIRYDAQGNVIGGTTRTDNLETKQADTRSFNSRGSTDVQSSFAANPDGSSEFKESGSDGRFRHEQWKPEGRAQSSKITYNPDGSVRTREKFLHEYDSYGNIIKSTRLVANGDSEDFQPATVSYRTFTYYEKN